MSVRHLHLRVLVASVAIAFIFAIVLGATGVAGGASAYAAGTTLSILSGDVMVRHASGDFAPANDGDVLHEGDTVRTTEGRAVLTYFEGSTVTVEPNSEVTIDATATASDGGTVVLMTQAAGRTWHVVTKLITGGSRYEVRTPASTASVRGTEFEVDAGADATTVTTTEGIVVQHVVDPAQPGSAVDVPVTAGTTQTQPRNARPAPAGPKPQPERTVTISVAAPNTIVVDPLGRANGVMPDGRVVVQTPGAQVRREGGAIVVTMPDLPDGTLATRVDGEDGTADDVAVTTTIAERGRSVSVEAYAKRGADKKAVTGFELRRLADGVSDGDVVDGGATNALPTPHVPRDAGSHRSLTPSPTLAPRTTRAVESASPSGTDSARPRLSSRPTETARATPSPRVRADGPASADQADADTSPRPLAPRPSQGTRLVVELSLPSLAPLSPNPAPSR